jgi:hypothetical protein
MLMAFATAAYQAALLQPTGERYPASRRLRCTARAEACYLCP